MRSTVGGPPDAPPSDESELCSNWLTATQVGLLRQRLSGEWVDGHWVSGKGALAATAVRRQVELHEDGTDLPAVRISPATGGNRLAV